VLERVWGSSPPTSVVGVNMEKVELSPESAIFILASVTASFFNAAKCKGIVADYNGEKVNVLLIDGELTIVKDEYPNLVIGQLIRN
jgi:hypothetical protein